MPTFVVKSAAIYALVSVTHILGHLQPFIYAGNKPSFCINMFDLTYLQIDVNRTLELKF